MIKKIVLGVLAIVIIIVVGLSIAISMQPDDFKTSRSTVISASPEKVFNNINDFHKWDAWSPWAKLDPNMQTTYSGAESGTGSSYVWKGNSDVGEGKMTITASHPNSHIAIDLEFMAPFAARNLTEFTMTPDGDKTNVTWSMAGKQNFISKAMCLVIDMDKMIGADFEKGLSQLKSVSETQ